MAFLRGRGEIGRVTGEPFHILHTCVRERRIHTRPLQVDVYLTWVMAGRVFDTSRVHQ